MVLNRLTRHSASFLRTSGRQQNYRNASSSHGNHADYPFGMHFHVNPLHKHLGMAFGTVMWLWIFYRAKEDGKALLGFEHPWDAHGHGHGHGSDHDHGHDQPIKYEKEIGERPMLV